VLVEVEPRAADDYADERGDEDERERPGREASPGETAPAARARRRDFRERHDGLRLHGLDFVEARRDERLFGLAGRACLQGFFHLFSESKAYELTCSVILLGNFEATARQSLDVAPPGPAVPSKLQNSYSYVIPGLARRASVRAGAWAAATEIVRFKDGLGCGLMKARGRRILRFEESPGH
jgi:hypothetical protein